MRRLLDQTPPHDTFAREALLRRWLVLDPAAAGAWAALALDDRSLDPKPTISEAELVFATVAATDPTGALKLIHESANGSSAVPFTYTILDILLKMDMAAGIAFGAACRESDSVVNWSFSPRHSNEWFKKDPPRAVALLGSLPPGEFRDYSLCGAVAALAEKDFAAALALHRKFPGIQPGQHSEDPRAGFYQHWAREDLEGFTKYVNEEATGKTRLAMKEAIATALGEKDPLTALPWIAENLSGPHRAMAVERTITQLAKSDPEAARNFLATLSEGSMLGTAVDTFLTALEVRDFKNMFSEAGALPDGPARVRLTGKAYLNWFQTDPSAALQELLKAAPQTLPDNLWHTLGQTSASAADGINQLKDLPAGTRNDFVKGLWEKHLGNASTADWSTNLEALSDPAQRSAALSVIAGGRNPGRVVDWAKGLPNPQDRKQIADGLQESLGHFPAKEREALLAPLR